MEGLDAASIADITGLTAANIAMKIHRMKKILAHRIREEHSHA
jgi:RNA polymerase sigma-70 factor (ECF subfamily)